MPTSSGPLSHRLQRLQNHLALPLPKRCPPPPPPHRLPPFHSSPFVSSDFRAHWAIKLQTGLPRTQHVTSFVCWSGAVSEILYAAQVLCVNALIVYHQSSPPPPRLCDDSRPLGSGNA